jgi:hypothetical protein
MRLQAVKQTFGKVPRHETMGCIQRSLSSSILTELKMCILLFVKLYETLYVLQRQGHACLKISLLAFLIKKSVDCILPFHSILEIFHPSLRCLRTLESYLTHSPHYLVQNFPLSGDSETFY